MRIATGVLAAGLTVMIALSANGADRPETSGVWSERVQVIYREDTHSVSRVKLSVWNPEPEKNLDFVWEPAPGKTIVQDGAINGSGKLTWRVRGSANYDPATVYSTYVGDMKNGRPNGQGRLRLRSGERYEGSFVDGLLSGTGLHVDAAGNRYEGMFAAGVEDGEGRLASTNGEIYTGTFRNGRKHGKGETRLSGGAVYVSQWFMGQESGRPTVVADATIGGLLKAQSGGGDAGKLDIAVAVEPRMTEQSDQDGGVAYQHLVRDDDIAIYPADQQMNDLWNGAGEITTGSAYVFEDRDWEYAPAFVEVDLSTGDGSRVKVDKLELQVASSESYRKPMLQLTQHVGCVGFRPSFSIKNFGWGEVRDLKMNLQFTGQDPGGAASRTFARDVGTFDEGIDVGIKDVLSEAGVDTDKLETKRYSCQSMDSINVCRSQVFNDVGFGEIADYVWGDDKLFTTATGTFDYNWADDAGTVYAASEPFRIAVSMAIIETPLEAECGAGFGGSPEALRYQDVRFPIGQKNYAIAMPMRGNKNISSYAARLKLQSEPAMSSFHQFKVAATLGDGSVKTSKPVNFFFLRPRIPSFTPGMTPASCYLPEGTYGC